MRGTSKVKNIALNVSGNYLGGERMSLIEDIKNTATKRTLDAFKSNLKKMTPDQIIDLMTRVANDTTINILKDVEQGMSLGELKEKWLKQ